jgi:hypothetical protein
MPYTIHKSDGTAVVVPDNTIDVAYYNATGGDGATGLGTQLIGRNAINYGAPVAQNFLQLTENFASGTAFYPSNATALQGQLWFNKVSPTTGKLFVRITGNTSGAFSTNWKEIVKQGDVFEGTASSALYSDLAERYAADAVYAPGTVLSIGGVAEVTSATGDKTTDVFGVVSTKPGFMMNAEAGDDKTHPYVALAGRVPVTTLGKVKKGQRLVTSGQPGVARALDEDDLLSTPSLAVIGRALEDKDTDGISQVLAVVGAR